ncbi:amino acid transporter [Anaeramoeba flamelloides]|uniref:Amino acid transporter n=1 Tax=Anaeramoeba flamelloides TaxID=1746091 RepID=A0AAV7ZQF4_9EUKA|nr:amino acid transporter [Anaeramoeba flamelloides]
MAVITKENRRPGLHLLGASFTLCNTLLGGGTLSVPFGFAVSGIVQGIFLLILCALISGYSLTLLDQMSRLTGQNSYKDLAEYIFNKRFSKFVSFIFILLIFGAVTAYFCFLGDLSDSLISSFFEDTSSSKAKWIDRRLFITIITILIILPLTFFRKIGSLRFPSYLVIIALFIVILQTLIHSIPNLRENGSNPKEISYFRFNLESLLAVPIFSLAFVCQVTFFPIKQELIHPTKRKVFLLILNTILLGLAFYLVVGIFAYLDFKDTTKGDILLNYSNDSVWSIFAQIGMIIAIVFSAPVIFFAGKTALRQVIYGTDSVENSKNVWYTSIIPFFAILILSLLIPDVVSIFSITGAFCGTLVVIIFPSLFFIKLGHNFKKQKNISKNNIPLSQINFSNNDDDNTGGGDEGDSDGNNEKEHEDESQNELKNKTISEQILNEQNLSEKNLISDHLNSTEDQEQNLLNSSETNFSENDDIEPLHLAEEVNEFQLELTRKKPIIPWITMVLGIILNIFCSIESIREFTKKRN